MKSTWFLLGLGLVAATAILAPRATPVVVRKLKKVRDRLEYQQMESRVLHMEESLRKGLVH